ncbi:MAG: DNA polymerase III, partial [Chloroflexi bacterium]|nr:DNA polymerase III [Chloroflexota bacterium]
RVLHGAEVEILPDGALDYPDEVLATLDLVTVSVHSALRQPREQLTRRIIRAIGNPHVHMLNHPTGRRLDRRPPCDIDLEAIVGTAAERGVALEINGNPERLDLNDLDARRVKEHGGLIATNTDAHSSGALAHLRYAVAMARRGWLEPRNVLNTYTLVQIERWLRQEKRAA